MTHTMPLSPFGLLLSRYRLAAGLTQEELAERAGMSARGISDLERGLKSRPRLSTLTQLADALGLSPDDRASFYAAARGGVTAPSLSSLPSLPSTLIANPLTPLLGRERDEAAVLELIRWQGARLVTLTGVGGVGKTRLALQVAERLRSDFADGMVPISLAALHIPALVLPTIATALDVRPGGGQPPQEALRHALQERRLLLLLDNCEQVREVAPQLVELLAACPNLVMLVTSRIPLHVRGEQEYAVRPLALPSPEQAVGSGAVTASPAVALFVCTAHAVQPGFGPAEEQAPLVAEICRRLDGLPLAIELAAARVKVLPPQILLNRLERRLPLLVGGPRDLPARQQTMRDTIAWSYDLLAPAAQQLFRRVAVFTGGWEQGAAEAVCQASGDPGAIDLLEELSSLVDQNLVAVRVQESGGLRFGMLETVREFGLECLADRGELDAVARAHAAYFLHFAQEAQPQLTGPEQGTWMDRLEREHDNLRAALDWARDHDLELALQLAAALWRFWFTRGYSNEGSTRLEALLQAAEGASVPTPVRADALFAAGAMAYGLADHAQARQYWEENLTLRRGLGDRAGIAAALNTVGIVTKELGDVDRAISLHEESAALYRELGDSFGLGSTLNNLGAIYWVRSEYLRAASLYEEAIELDRAMGRTRGFALTLRNLSAVLQDLGDYGRATELAQESLAVFQEIGDRENISTALGSLGEFAMDQGDDLKARELLEESLRITREIGANGWTALNLLNLGLLAIRQGDLRRARSLMEESLALYREAEYTRGMGVAAMGLGDVARDEGDYSQAEALYQESLALVSGLGNALDVVMTLEHMSRLAVRKERWERAAMLIGAARRIRERIGAPLPPPDQAIHDRELEAMQRALGEVRMASHLDQASHMSLSEAVAYAQDEDPG